MCGIVGYIGHRNATEILLDGLRRLEYRGYDSAGIAVHQKKTVIVRAEGKLAALESKVRRQHPRGNIGIGHTRWATHGRPSETNAHPHQAGSVILVHNGIVENYMTLRHLLERKGHTIDSETDTEVICHLVQQRRYDGLPMEKAFRKALGELKGSYALVLFNEEEPGRLYLARKGSPLVVGFGRGEFFVASDIPALLPYTRRVLFLEDGDWGVVDTKELRLYDASGKMVRRAAREVTWSQAMAEKGGHKHFMLKEILEQPRAIADTLSGQISDCRRKVHLNGAEDLMGGRFPFNKIYLIACGTSYHAALVGQYYLEEMTGLMVRAELASEFRYRSPVIDKKTLLVAISQSGETADTLGAVHEAKRRGAKILSICNVVDSSLSRGSHAALYTHAGPEIGVASTKAFTTQLLLLLLLALRIGQAVGRLTPSQMREVVECLSRLPQLMGKILRDGERIAELAAEYADRSHFLYLARGVNYPIALEGALKLKEISYIHAEGYAAGEMKHGPIALIDPDLPVVVLAPQDATYEKMVSNVEEVRARGGDLIALVTQGDKHLASKCRRVITIPKVPWYLTPILLTLPLQQLAYYIADHRGTDVDQPRNLAKSVTVE